MLNREMSINRIRVVKRKEILFYCLKYLAALRGESCWIFGS